MSDLGTATGIPPQSTAQNRPPQRSVQRRRSLPSGRAVVGGFLVAVAALGVFMAYLAATMAPVTPWVVAARDLRVGETITQADLEVVAIDLPAAQAARSFNVAEVLVGAVVVAPLGRGELVQQSSVAVSGGPGLEQISFAIDPERALLGVIKPNERVDVLATYGTGESAYTILLARGALVLEESELGGGVGGTGGKRVFVLGLADSAQAVAISHALTAGQVALIRATARDPLSPPGPESYRPSFDGPSTAGTPPAVDQPGAGASAQEQDEQDATRDPAG